MRRLRVTEPFRSLFYAPQFVALHGGHFSGEGIEVTVQTAGGGISTVGALLDGTTEISLGGLMRSFELADRDGGILVHFAEVNSRNGFFFLSREPRPRFQWSDLGGTTVIDFAEAPTPWQCLLAVLRRHGVDPARVTIIRDLSGSDAVAAFRAGRGDFLQQGQPVTEELLAEGAAHLVASMGEATGPVPFSSYMTTPKFLKTEPDVILRFTRALYRAQSWMASHTAREIARVIAPAFPEIEPEIRTRVIDRYLKQGTWACDPVLRKQGFDYLQQILLGGGFIKRRHRYEELVDAEIAERAVRSEAGAGRFGAHE